MHIYFTMDVLSGIRPKTNVVFNLFLSFLKNEARIPDLCKKILYPLKNTPLLQSRQLLFNVDSRKLHRLNTFLGHEPLGKRFDLCSITMH